jgi:hypothetical protein
VVNDGELSSAVITSTVDVLANMPVPADQALQAPQASPHVVPPVPPGEQSWAQIDKIVKSDKSPLREWAGLTDEEIEELNREIERLLAQLSQDNLPTPPELLLETENDEGDDQEEEELQLDEEEGDSEEGDDEEVLEEELPVEPPQSDLPPAVAPGLAAQISDAAQSFEKSRQELLAEGGEKQQKTPAVDQKAISEAFNEVFELLQCR